MNITLFSRLMEVIYYFRKFLVQFFQFKDPKRKIWNLIQKFNGPFLFLKNIIHQLCDQVTDPLVVFLTLLDIDFLSDLVEIKYDCGSRFISNLFLFHFSVINN